jgi:hypothetical protein
MAVEKRPTGGDGVLQVIQDGSDPVKVEYSSLFCTHEEALRY